ncbi:MAG TPA: hypothetical protein VGH27_07470 [Streptosporangiaceae bacterium]|jgi:hypothetical protein
MTRTATLETRVTSGLPVIDPHSLTAAQCAGRRCAVRNCRRRLVHRQTEAVGRLPDGRPVLACYECAPAVIFDRA